MWNGCQATTTFSLISDLDKLIYSQREGQKVQFEFLEFEGYSGFQGQSVCFWGVLGCYWCLKQFGGVLVNFLCCVNKVHSRVRVPHWVLVLVSFSLATRNKKIYRCLTGIDLPPGGEPPLQPVTLLYLSTSIDILQTGLQSNQSIMCTCYYTDFKNFEIVKS